MKMFRILAATIVATVFACISPTAFALLLTQPTQPADPAPVEVSLPATTITQLFNTPEDPMAGNLNGTVTLVEFFDYECPHCMAMSSLVSELIQKNPQLRVIYKELPVVGSNAKFNSSVALAAQKQGKYDAFHDALIASTAVAYFEGKRVSDEEVFTIANSVGLNVDQVKKDMQDASVTQQIHKNIKLAQSLKLIAVPAFFAIKTATLKNPSPAQQVEFLHGQTSPAALQLLIDKAGK